MIDRWTGRLGRLQWRSGIETIHILRSITVASRSTHHRKTKVSDWTGLDPKTSNGRLPS